MPFPLSESPSESLSESLGTKLPLRHIVQSRPLVLLLALLFVAAPLSADESASPERTDTVAGLLDLLEADMTEDVILLWLETRESEPAPPSAEDLVALRDAGAGDEILKKLLSLTAGMPSSETASPQAEDETAPSSRTAAPERAPAPEPAPERAQPSMGDAVVDFTLSYVPDFRADEKEWNLYVYLDGKPLAYVARGDRLLGAGSLEFQQALEPGRHQIRIAQENHEPGDDPGDSYLEHVHEARLSPVDLVFQLEPGAAEVEIRFKRSLVEDFRTEGPIDYRIAAGGRVLLAEEGAGGDPDGWTPVCDDATAVGHETPHGCRGWPTFWTVDAPPRREVLRALSLFEYRPVPRNQKVH